MSKSNANLPITAVVPLGSLASGATVPALHLPFKSRIMGVRLLNGASIAAGSGNWAKLELKNGSEVLASLDTSALQEGAVTANVAKDFDLDSSGELVDAATDLKCTYSEQEGEEETFRITVPEDMLGADLDLKGFTCADDAGSVDFWFDVDNAGGTEPVGLAAAARGIEITTISALDEAADIVAKLIVAIDADSKFVCIQDPDDEFSVLVTASAVGTRTDVADGLTTEASGLGLEVVDQGAAVVAQALTNAQLCIDYYPL